MVFTIPSSKLFTIQRITSTTLLYAVNPDALLELGYHCFASDGSFGFDCGSYPDLPRSSDEILSVPRSHAQVLNPFGPIFPSAATSGWKRSDWKARDTDGALYLTIEMPGLDKEDVKVTLDEKILIIKGESQKELDDHYENSIAADRKYGVRFDLTEMVYKIDEIRVDMKNGVLNIVLPKGKEEDSTDIKYIKVE